MKRKPKPKRPRVIIKGGTLPKAHRAIKRAKQAS